MFDLDGCLDALAAQAHTDGGWGYTSDQAAHLEPTCLSLLALSLRPERYAAAVDRAFAAVARCASPDGTYRQARGREEAVWHTAQVLFVQAALGRPAAEVRRTASALLNLRGRVPEDHASDEIHDIDLTLVGWPWAVGNFSWVEPTAWACLALCRAGLGSHPRADEGRRLLLDRARDEGGINYGNRRILGRLTEPMPGPTALMLLALQGHAGEARVAAAVGYLLRQVECVNDLELLCWIKLALDLYPASLGVAETLPQLDERIIAAREGRAGTAWVRPAPHREALTALSLAARETSLFRLDRTPGGSADAVHSTQSAVLSTQCPAPRTEWPQPGAKSHGGSTPSCVLGTGYPEPGAPSAASRRRPLGERLKSAFQGLAVKAVVQLRPPPPPAAVHIARATDYDADLTTVLRGQYEHFRQQVPLAGKRVVLKPNLVEYHRDKVINTDPRVVAAVIRLCRDEGAAEVIVAEGPGHCRNVEYLVRASGLGEVLEQHRVPFVDLNHDEPVKLLNLGRLTGLEHLFLARTVARAEVLVSLPKLKTHHWAGATLSLKNLFGTLPGICYGWPKNELHWRGIDNSIIDIALTRPPELAIVDGIIGMEGDGPLNGTPKPLGALVMGTDCLAVDATCCRLMHMDPEKLKYLVLGQRKRLGQIAEAGIRQIGEAIEAVAQPFETIPQFREVCFAANGGR